MRPIILKFFLIFFALMLASGVRPALAQTCAAKTCSEAYRACTGKHCARQHSGGRDCARFCGDEVERCMKTGEFRGRVCHKTRLIKK